MSIIFPLLFFLCLPYISISNEITLLRLKLYLNHQPTTIHTTVAVFHHQFRSSLGVQSIFNDIHPLPWSTPKKILRSSFDNRPGLAGMLSMTCGTHANNENKSTILSSIEYIDQNDYDRCLNRHKNRVDSEKDWSQPPAGLLILPRHDCSVEGDEKNVPASKKDTLSHIIQIALGKTNIHNNELLVAFVLTWEDNYIVRGHDTNGILEHDVVKGKTSSNQLKWMAEVLDMLSSTCVLSRVSLQNQIIFPPGQFVWLNETNSSHHRSLDQPLDQPIKQWKTTKMQSKSYTYVIVNNIITTQQDDDNEEASSSSSSSPSTLIPPLPNYCSSLKNENATNNISTNKHSPHILQALHALHETSFIEENMKMTEFPIPFVDTILEFIMKLLLPAIINPFTEYYEDEIGGRVSEEVGHKIVGQVPVDVVKLLTPPLTYNVSNLLTDALTASVSKSLITSLTMEFGAPISKEISSNLMTSLYNELNVFLDTAIDQKIVNVLPYLMSRSLPITLTKRITRSLTHALVPTLSRSLSSTSKSSHQRYWCDLCYRKALHCNYCHDSPQSQYYTNFYSNYYSDYYVEYYEPYYTQALTDLDKVQHPSAKQQQAKEQNNGGKGMKTGNPVDASYRPVTADGGKLSDDGIV
jgi:hypothetical protein